MYNGFFEVFVGFGCIVLSIFRKNQTIDGASFIRRHNKILLIIFGIWMVTTGTIDFLKENR